MKTKKKFVKIIYNIHSIFFEALSRKTMFIICESFLGLADSNGLKTELKARAFKNKIPAAREKKQRHGPN